MIEKMKEVIKYPSVRYTYLSAIASGLNFVTLIIWGRIFSVEAYAAATTLQALVSNISTFMAPLPVMICILLAGTSVDQNRDAVHIMGIFGIINTVELIMAVLGADKLMQYLSFSGIIEVILFIILFLLNNFYLLLVCLAQGNQDFELLGKAGVLLYLIKLLLSAYLGICGINHIAVVIGWAIADIVCVILMLRKLIQSIQMQLNMDEIRLDMNILKQYVWLFILSMIVSIYMNNGDLLLGNLYCSKAELGVYSATIGLSKINVYLIATPIATIVLPKMTAVKEEKKERSRILIWSEMITLVCSLLYGICFYVLGGWIIPLVYGEAYSGASEYLLPCIFFSIVVGIFYVFYQYILAADLTKVFTVVTVAIGVMAIVWILKMKIELSGIPIIMAIAMILTMTILAIYLVSAD